MSSSRSRRGITFRSRQLGYVAVGGLAVVGGIILGVRYLVASPSAAPASSAEDDLAALALPPPSTTGTAAVPPAQASPGEASLSAEIAKIRPLISETNGPLDRGTATLALWASTHLTWADLKALPTTSPALFRKDPDEERGHVICIDGAIVEIHAEKNLQRRLLADRAVANGGDVLGADAGASHGVFLGADDAEWAVPGGKLFIATVAEPDRSAEHGKLDDAQRARRFAVEAIAVKSSGTLVDGNSARFCGILTGVVQTASDIHLLHRAVGMFDLPENTGAPARTGSPSP